MKKLAIIGSGDLGQLMAYHAIADNHYEVVGYFDDFKKVGEHINGIPILGKLSDIEQQCQSQLFDEIICAIGYKHLDFRHQIYTMLAPKVKFGTIVHSSCYIDKSSKIGDGVLMLPGSVIDTNVKIEDNVVINVSCTIAHDSIVKSHSFLSPRVAIAGFVTVGERCNIGINTTIIDNISISNDVQTGGGTVIHKNLINKGLYVGNPARFIR